MRLLFILKILALKPSSSWLTDSSVSVFLFSNSNDPYKDKQSVPIKLDLF